MEVLPIHTRLIRPPQDDLCAAIRDSELVPKEGDCIAVTSKVVSIWKGRCVRIDPTSQTQRDDIAKQEASFYLPREHVPHERSLFTLTHNILIGGAGIDASNADGYFVLWPRDPAEAARDLLAWFKHSYGIEELYLIITDSRSLPLRRGAIGCALAWAGFDPLVDHTKERDLYGRRFQAEHTNLADALAASAVLVMGETDAATPLAVIRGAPYLAGSSPVVHEPPYEVPPDEDLFAPFIQHVPWEKGGGGAE